MKIGETFSYNGKTYVAEPATDDICAGCAFWHGRTPGNDCLNAPDCIPDAGEGDIVIFKEVTQ